LAFLAFAGEHIGFRCFLPVSPLVMPKYGDIVMQADVGLVKSRGEMSQGRRLKITTAQRLGA
jgi:hypothetical protein